MHFVLESVKSRCRLKSRIVNMPAKGNSPLLRLTRHERWQTTLLLDAATGNAGLRGDHHADLPAKVRVLLDFQVEHLEQ